MKNQLLLIEKQRRTLLLLFSPLFIWVSGLYLYLMYYFGIITANDDLFSTFKEPLIILFYIAYIGAYNYYLFKRLNAFKQYLKNPVADRLPQIQKWVAEFPKVLGLLIVLFPNVAALIHIAHMDNALLNNLLGWLFNFVFAVLIPLPVYFYGYQVFEKMVHNIPFSTEYKPLSLSWKLGINIVVNSVGIIVLFVISNLAFINRFGSEENVVGILAQKNMLLAIFAMIISTLNFLLVRRMTLHPIRQLASFTENLAQGQLSDEIYINERDEIGQLGHSIASMRNATNTIATDLYQTIQSVQEGNIQTRVESDKAQGDWRAIFVGINELIEAFARPIDTTNNYLHRMAIGDIPEPLTETFNGDFNDLKISLNNLIDANKEIIDKAHAVAQGDLTVALNKRSDQDQLMDSLSNMVSAIASMLGQVHQAAKKMAMASQQINNIAQQVSTGAEEQATSSEQVASSLEEISSSINQNTDNSKHADQLARALSNNIQVVSKAFANTLNAMNDIVDKVGAINDIAGKTDLLAINAAIEAARAGELGKGFSVVASEVRELSEHSLKEAHTIEMVSGTSKKQAEQSRQLMDKIIPDIKQSSQLVQEITAASTEQNTGIQQVNNALQQLSGVIQQNSSVAEQMSTSAQELSHQSDDLLEAISQFKTQENQGDYESAREIKQQIQALQEKMRHLQQNQTVESKTHYSQSAHLQPKPDNGVEINLNNPTNDSKDLDFDNY